MSEMPDGPRPDDATRAQIAASDPAANVWLVANAGTGKTKVLTDRVARLLLGGADPLNILCLTYTKAAAAEMQNRLFARLGAWAMAPDDVLGRDLATLGAGAMPDGAGLRNARRLFARAIETPGGIRIQTIHAFCAGLLRRFPLEAGISPAFAELDDRSASRLAEETLEEMARGPDAPLFEALLPLIGERIMALVQEIIANRAVLATPPDAGALASAFGLPGGMDEEGLVNRVLGADGRALLQTLLPVLLAGSTTDQRAGEKLAGLLALDELALIEGLEGILLYGAGAKIKTPFGARTGRFPTKASRAKIEDQLPALDDLMKRVEEGREWRLSLRAEQETRTLYRFATAFLARHEAAKAARARLDFDDLITRATRLVTDESIAPWVLYRLDGAIDHILVDEAQDTSPEQWNIIAALAAEFTAGRGAHARPRSLFVVGDRKQSIYSFQGADVAAFDEWKDQFSRRFAGIDADLRELPLVHSFRSSPLILSLVDACFDGARNAALGGPFAHHAFYPDLPGRVEIWPAVDKPEHPAPGPWYEPVDLVHETDAPVVLADRVAARIRALLDAGTRIPDRDAAAGARPLHAGDFLILVQRRSEIFDAVIRACKARGLPVAGADRLDLTEELAVRDVIALLSFLNTPEDDLALATALRSPLFGWSEGELFDLAHPRTGYLWEALRQSGRDDTLAILRDLRDSAEFLRPYELIERILIRHDGRARLIGRMGEEVADALDELCQQALIHEQTEVPSLTGFLVWMEAASVDIKRQTDQAAGKIRVMTVHGAKGLEAPVVILPDTGTRRLPEQALVIPLGGDIATLTGKKDEDSAALRAEKARRQQAREAENLRLLYVALTRAKCWLMVGAAGEAGGNSWYRAIREGAEALGYAATPDGGLARAHGAWPHDEPPSTMDQDEETPTPGRPVLPPLPAAPAPVRIWSPSALGGAVTVDAGAGVVTDGDAAPDTGASESPESAEDARARGTLLHLALQHMAGASDAARRDMAARLHLPPELAEEAEEILARPDLGWIFAPGSLAEVEVAVPWRGGFLAGSIDRLVIDHDRVTIVDFKSNRTVPLAADAVPAAYLAQLGAYRLAIAALYPDRRVETAILWTRLPFLMPIDAALADRALGAARPPDAALLDGTPPRS